MQQDVKYMVIFISITLERNFEKDSTNTGTTLKTDQIAMNSHTQIPTRHCKGYKVSILKGNLHQKHERELWEDNLICLFDTKAPLELMQN